MKVVVVRNKIQTLLWEIFRVEVSSWSSYFSWMFVKDFQLHSFECWIRLIWERLEQCLTIFTCLTDSLLTSFHIYDVSTSRRLDVSTSTPDTKFLNMSLMEGNGSIGIPRPFQLTQKTIFCFANFYRQIKVS